MKSKRIESPRNPAIREARALAAGRTGASGRGGGGTREFLIEGPNLLASALGTGAGISKLFFTPGAMPALKRYMRQLEASGAAIIEVSEAAFKAISDTEAPQGVAAVASLEPVALGDLDPSGAVVVLDGIQDPGNVGTIIRTADASGAGGVVVLGGTCDPFNPKALRASAGSIFNIPVVFASRKAIGEELRKSGRTIAVTAASGGVSIYDADLSGPIAVVLGNEARGVSPALKSAADLLIRIPIVGEAESLNVASSAAVVLYECLRQGG